jgi:hypothetical protein
VHYRDDALRSDCAWPNLACTFVTTTWECALAGEDVSQSIYTDCAGAFSALAEFLYTGQSMGIRIASAGMAAENAWNFPDNHVYTTQDERQSGFHCTARLLAVLNDSGYITVTVH